MRSVFFSSHSIFLVCLLAVISPAALAQATDSSQSGNSHQSVFVVTAHDSIYEVGRQFIIEGSDSVWLDSTRLQSGRDYLLDRRFGTLTIRRSKLLPEKADTTARHVLTVRYNSLPFAFQPKYQHRVPVVKIDTLTKEERTVAKPTRPFSVDDLFGSNLQKSGSIVRGLSIGSNRDLSLSSGFRMQMSGNISDNVEVIASLTDENTPIQPEGTTQTLQEIDKVFVQIRGSDLSATLGDFNLNLDGNEFARLSRKLQGAQAIANYRTSLGSGDVLIAGATTRGKFATNQFQGLDGVQGPYQLTGQNGERDIIAIAGTERVYVDGEQMTRGELNDYTIDYANAEITFASRRLISAASRITVDYEYSDRQFTRNLYAIKTDNKFLSDKLTLSTTLLREGDDKDSPIDISLSDTDKTILRNAGSNRMAATESGVDSVGPGNGQYSRLDTTVYSPDSLKSVPVTIYKFDPGDSLYALFTITFSAVGPGNGDYDRIAPGVFQFIGIRQGSYAPLRLLPMPQEYSLADFAAGYEVVNGVTVTGEYATSNFNANLFSDKPDVEQTGSASKFGLALSPKNIRIGELNLGSLDVNLKERYVNKDFVALDRVNEIEFDRKWNIDDSVKVDEVLREGDVTYRPFQSLALGGGVGSLTRGSEFSSDRSTANLRLAGENLPKVDWDLEVIKSQNSALSNSGSWLRQHGSAEYTMGKFTPGIRYENEDRETRFQGAGQDSLEFGSFRFHEIAPKLSLDNIGLMSLNMELGWRLEDSLAGGELREASTIFSQQYGWKLNEWNSLSSSLDLRIRDRAFTDVFKERGNTDVRTLLVRSQTRYNPFNRAIESEWFYEVASDRTTKLERVFQSVPVGTGDYIYVGDMNHNGIVDEPDFQLVRFDGNYVAVTVPSDQFIPVTDLKTSSRIRLNGSRILPPSSSIGQILSTLSTETIARVDEKSSESDVKEIYLLHFSRFLNNSTTLEGSNLFSQDVYFLENNPAFSVRLRFLQRKGLTEFTLQNERTYSREQSVRVRWSLVKEIANETDIAQKTDLLASTGASFRVRSIQSNSLTTDWSYRPEQRFEFGFNIGVSRAINFDTTVANINNQSVRIVYSFEAKGQVRVDFSREEVLMNRPILLFPFELTGGKAVGKTWLWRGSFDYRFTQFIQATMSYDGRNEGGAQTIHTARAEVRAFF